MTAKRGQWKPLPKRKMHMEFSITNEDIDGAKCADARKCAIALAMARKLNLAHGYIHVSAQALKFTKGKIRWRAFVSNRVLDWFAQFDRYGKGRGPRPDPFRFRAGFEAYSWKTERTDAERIKGNRQAREDTLRAAGKKVKKYNRRERLVGANLSKVA